MSNFHAKALALVALLVAVSTGTCQITGPKEQAIEVAERNIKLDFTVDADSAEYVVVGRTCPEIIREPTSDPNRLRLAIGARKEGDEGHVIVMAVKAGKQLYHVCRVWVPGPKPPVPVPPEPKPPDPKPPEPKPPEPKPPEPIPVDPLVRQIQAAADLDGLPRSKLIDVAKAARTASEIETKGQTAQRAHDLIKNALSKSPPLGAEMIRLMNSITGDKFNELLKNPTEIVDQYKAEAIKAPFVKLAKALEEAAK